MQKIIFINGTSGLLELPSRTDRNMMAAAIIDENVTAFYDTDIPGYPKKMEFSCERRLKNAKLEVMPESLAVELMRASKAEMPKAEILFCDLGRRVYSSLMSSTNSTAKAQKGVESLIKIIRTDFSGKKH